MKTAPGILVLSVLVGTVSGGLTSLLVSSSRDAQGAASVQPVAGSSHAAEALEALREETLALRKRVEWLEARPDSLEASRTPAGSELTLADFEEFQREVRSWMTSADGVSDSPAELEVGVERVLSSIRDREAQEKERRRLQRQEQRIDRRVERLTPKLELNQQQQDELRTVFTTLANQNTELKRAWEAGGDLQALGETKRTNYETYDSELERILTPDQLEAFRSEESDK